MTTLSEYHARESISTKKALSLNSVKRIHSLKNVETMTFADYKKLSAEDLEMIELNYRLFSHAADGHETFTMIYVGGH